MITEIEIGEVISLILRTEEYSKEAAFVMAAKLEEEDERGSRDENKSLYIHEHVLEKCFYETKTYKDAACIIEGSLTYCRWGHEKTWLDWFNGQSGHNLTQDSSESEFKNALKSRLETLLKYDEEVIEVTELSNSVLVFWEKHLPWCEHDYTPFEFS